MKKIIVFAFIFSVQFLTAQIDPTMPEAPPTPEKQIEEEDSRIYTSSSVDSAPRFAGGLEKFYQFFYANFKIPEGMSIAKLYVSFIVEKDGSLSGGVVNGNFGTAITQEVTRVLKLSPKWIPGKKYDHTIKIVRCSFAMPFEFGNTTAQKK